MMTTIACSSRYIYKSNSESCVQISRNRFLYQTPLWSLSTNITGHKIRSSACKVTVREHTQIVYIHQIHQLPTTPARIACVLKPLASRAFDMLPQTHLCYHPHPSPHPTLTCRRPAPPQPSTQQLDSHHQRACSVRHARVYWCQCNSGGCGPYLRLFAQCLKSAALLA